MSNVTKEQKQAFLHIAESYNTDVYDIIRRGSSDEIIISSQSDADKLEEFSGKVCDLVFKDYPDIEGKHEDINADAEMIVHIIADVLTESQFK